MSYAAKSDIEARLHVEDLRRMCFFGVPDDYETTELYDAARDDAVETRCLTALADAADFMDGFLAERYAVPVSPVPGVLRTLNADIAVYYLHALKQGPEGTQWEKRYEAAVKMLEKFQKGEVSLGASVAAGATLAEFSGETRIFTRPKMRGF